MRIIIRTEEGKTYCIPVPFFVLKVGTGKWMKNTIKKHIKKDKEKYIDCINFRELHKAVNILKQYKGLDIVDIKAKDGSVINIRL